ncbi:uncharacterized protein [Antedon mediterranea]|uniref:uncharacterized protein n=1 Tax=Antedon mediterranea TaxID=105859 RepID=UPI003AF57FFE
MMTLIKNALVILLVICNHWITLAVDVCNNRCQQFKYVYCNELTAICENCNIYCEEDSQFYNSNKCQSLGCLDEPVVLDACSNRCLDFPMTYCNVGTGVCDPCEIWCSKDSVFFDVTKCTDKCPGMVSPTPIELSTPDEIFTPSSTVATAVTTASITYSTTQAEPVHDAITSDNSQNMFIGMMVFAAIVLLVLIVLLIVFIYRRRYSKINLPNNVERLTVLAPTRPLFRQADEVTPDTNPETNPETSHRPTDYPSSLIQTASVEDTIEPRSPAQEQNQHKPVNDNASSSLLLN